MNKEDEYAKKIISHMAELFDDTEGENFIDTKEFMEGNNATHFTHALANISPAMIIKKLTGSSMNLLEFNHMANQLVFQYSDLVKK